MSSNNRKWKKTLLPTLGSRRKGRDFANRLHASRTASDINVTAAMSKHAEGPSPDCLDDEVDERVVSVLLETTGEVDDESQPVVAKMTRPITRSQTEGIMACTENPIVPGSPTRVHNQVAKLSTPPRRSSKRNIQPVARGFPTACPSPKGSADGLVRPLPKLRSSDHLGYGTRQVIQSPSVSPSAHPAHNRGKGGIRKSGTYLDKVHNPLVSVLTGKDDLNGSATDSTGFATLPKMSRLRKNKVFAKFANALAEHFGRQETYKEVGDGVNEPQSVSSNAAIKPMLHRLPLDRLTLAQLPLPNIEASSTSTDRCSNEDGSLEHRRGSVPVEEVRTALTVPRKRLQMVEGSPPLEDPFSEQSPGRQSTEFEARLKTIQASGAAGGPDPVVSLTDPFLTEAIMDTSDNSILKTPPIGSSTPRTQVRSMIAAPASTQGTRVAPGTTIEMALMPRRGQPKSPSKRHRFAVIYDSPTKLDPSPECGQRDVGSCSPSKTRGSSDSTMLSSFPPGSTIRHVPRSMGRLHGLPDLAASAARRKSPKFGRKKHPSPSKRDLDLYGKFMEESVGLGVFKDADELAMSFVSCTGTNSPALTPRDKNNLLRGSNDKYCDSGKGFSPKGPVPGIGAKSRSRIPQPVSQRARSRTETAFARDFAPVNHGDSTTEDELQWTSSTYNLGGGRESRCYHCGNTSDAV